MAAVDLSHIVNRTTLSRRIFKSPAVWLVASSVTLSCELSQNSKMLQEKLYYFIVVSTVRMNLPFAYTRATVTRTGMQTRQSVFLRNEKSHQSR